MNKQHHGTTKSSDPTDIVVPAVDPGILAFGTSVSVNDDLRRSIASEIQEIDANCTKIKEAINVETKVYNELMKSKLRSDGEVLGLRQGAADGLDTINMSIQILHGLERTLHTETSFRQGDNLDGANGTGTSECMDNPFGGRASDNDVGDGMITFQDSKKNRTWEITELQAALTSKLKTFRETRIKRKELERENEWMVLKIEEELVMPLTKLQESADRAQETLEYERTRIESLKENLKAVNDRNLQMKNNMDLKTEEFNSTKDGFAKERLELEDSLHDLQEQSRLEQDILKAHERELDLLQRVTTDMQQRQTEAEGIIAEREEKKTEMEKNNSKCEELCKEQDELEFEITRLKDQLMADRRICAEYELKKLSIEAMKDANDKMEAEMIIPAQAEILELAAEKEKLDLFIETFLSEGRIEKEKVNNDIIATEKEIVDLDNELDDVMKQIDAKKSVVVEHKRIYDDHEDATAKEISAMELRKYETLQQLSETNAKIEGLHAESQKRIEDDDAKLLETQRKYDILLESKRMLDDATLQERNLVGTLKGKREDKKSTKE